MIDRTLRRMHICYSSFETIREKEGVGVYRVFRGDMPSLILKTFAKEDDRREIANYHILQTLGIRTLQLLATTEDAILLEDVEASPVLRLGCAEDMDDPQLCTALGGWYRLLHERGRGYIAEYGAKMYAETDCLTRGNMELVMRRTDTQDLPVWQAVFDTLPRLSILLSKMTQTLTYNDFYYTNLIAAKDKSSAFMFDYNLLGRGLAASDIRNVTWSLGENGKRAFLRAYGEVDKLEEQLDDVASILVTLYSASQRPVFPRWAEESLQALKNGKLSNAIARLPGVNKDGEV
ncbi:MAG: hypothetical protein VB111_11580 [Clostridiaceae bacterium]|nr:hypothetical protein [Clostridiaceae bacterium]